MGSIFEIHVFFHEISTHHRNLSSTQQPGIILLKEGTDSSQGKPQLISNINACQFIADAVRTTLGPRGMDKLIVDSGGVCFSSYFVDGVQLSVVVRKISR